MPIIDRGPMPKRKKIIFNLKDIKYLRKRKGYKKNINHEDDGF